MPFLVIEAPTLTVDQPAEGASFENGAIPVAGQGHERGVGRGQRRVRRLVRAAGRSPARRRPRRRRRPAPVTVPVADDGSFSTPYELTAGRWAITVTASSPEGKTAR